jgi:hypothetical protein
MQTYLTRFINFTFKHQGHIVNNFRSVKHATKQDILKGFELPLPNQCVLLRQFNSQSNLNIFPTADPLNSSVPVAVQSQFLISWSTVASGKALLIKMNINLYHAAVLSLLFKWNGK